MLLALDIGNSNIVAGIFSNGSLIKTSRTDTNSNKLTKWLKSFKKGLVEGVIISSVVPKVDKKITSDIRSTFNINPMFITSDLMKQILDIKPPKKHEIGADRLVNAFAVKKLYGKPAIIIDFGTATTFCALSKNGEYLGGAISPGIAISRDALHEKTAKLPFIELKPIRKAIGEDTKKAMLSGILLGYAGIVEKITGEFRNMIGKNATVIATGGLAGLIAGQTDIIDIIDKDLTLKGLKLIWDEVWRS